MQYQKLKTMYTTLYQAVGEILKEIFSREKYQEGDLFIRNPTTSAGLFLTTFERLRRESERVTPQNIDRLYPTPDDAQLELNLEGRLRQQE